jgi:hypothetical protein
MGMSGYSLPAESIRTVVLRHKVEGNSGRFPRGKTIDISENGNLAIRMACCVGRGLLLAGVSLIEVNN